MFCSSERKYHTQKQTFKIQYEILITDRLANKLNHRVPAMISRPFTKKLSIINILRVNIFFLFYRKQMAVKPTDSQSEL